MLISFFSLTAVRLPVEDSFSGSTAIVSRLSRFDPIPCKPRAQLREPDLLMG